MLIIAHRGNLNGPSQAENEPDYVQKAWRLGVDCEIDVHYVRGHFYLGHDVPRYKVPESYLERNGMWCHAKNLDAFLKMLENKKIHCFWHQEDDFALTSKKYIWTYPGKKTTRRSVIVSVGKDWVNEKHGRVFGICTDYPQLKK